MNDEQVKELLKPIDSSRVGKDGKGFAHVEAWDIRRRMNQIFGFGNWSADVAEMIMISEREVTTKQGKPAWYVVYRARCTVRIGEAFNDGYCTYTEWAAGDATNPVLGDAHDQAIKTAESQAFKRACVNLGDQFGLSLYNSGSTAASVGDVVGREHADSDKVETWVNAFDVAEDQAQVMRVVDQVKAADLSEDDRSLLIQAYKDAIGRVSRG